MAHFFDMVHRGASVAFQILALVMAWANLYRDYVTEGYSGLERGEMSVIRGETERTGVGLAL